MAPGVLDSTYSCCARSPSPSFRRALPFSPNDGDGLARPGVERVQPLSGRDQDALVVAALPEHDAAVHAEGTSGRSLAGKRVEHPALHARSPRRAQRSSAAATCRRARRAPRSGCTGFGTGRRVARRRAIGPRHLEVRDVRGVDLRCGGGLGVARIAAMRGPVPVCGLTGTPDGTSVTHPSTERE